MEFTITISDENLARANAAAQADRDTNLKRFVKDRVKELVLEYEKHQAAHIAEQEVVVEEDFIVIG